MYKSLVYKEEGLLGEVEIHPTHEREEEEIDGEENERKRKAHRKKCLEEIKMKGVMIISHFSAASERCPPLAVLHTITSNGICFKMNAQQEVEIGSPLHLLHSYCLQDNKTAVVPLGDEELHLVAMDSRKNEYPCFWGFIVAAGLYNSCLVMLNLRCLGIVFDLDETLVVANTMRSFEDRIDGLQRKISTEVDPQRISGMVAEVKRYQDDKMILKQYVDNDQVVENGKVIRALPEVVPGFSDNQQPMVRPLIRIPERNIILTRINPQIRDTSVLVRLRPAWEDLRSYLTARGRKRFEVYVCTMAERDYALEMWRLLDPESNLINSKELLERIVCVKSGSRKSLFNVFQDGICHPKMALVIDDRLKVWVDKDQPRVHVVPAFAPYYAPQAEANNAIPILCVARNVACNVRGGFFKEFDDGLLQKISDVSYEDDINCIPSPPDVSNYLVSEDDASASNGNKDPLSFDGMADAEVERRLKEAISASSVIPSTVNSTVQTTLPHLDPRLLASLQLTLAASMSSDPLQSSQPSAMPYPTMPLPQAQVASLVKPLNQVGHPESSFQSSPVREEGEVPESELDPDTRRRLLILQHGQDVRENTPSEKSFPIRPSMQVPPTRTQSHGNWPPMEEEMSPRQLNRGVNRMSPVDPEPVHFEKHRPHPSSLYPKMDSSIPSDRMLQEDHRFSKEVPFRDDQLRLNHTVSSYRSFSGEEVSFNRPSSSNRDTDFESDRPTPSDGVVSAETPLGALQEIAVKCGTKVEFRPSLVASRDLQFSVESYELKDKMLTFWDSSVTWLAGEKVGEGIGRTRREAQHQAAEGSIKNLAGIYMSRSKPDSGSVRVDPNRYSSGNENGFSGDMFSFGNHPSSRDGPLLFSSVSQPCGIQDPRLEGSKKSMGSVLTLKELCMTEGLDLNFLAQTPLNANQPEEVHAQVEIDGRVVADGIGSTWDEAKTQAAEKALGSLRTMLGQHAPKRQVCPRSMQGMPNKRLKQEFPRFVHRMPSAARYSKNAPVP